MANSYLDKDGLLYFLQKIRPNATPSMDGTASTGSATRFANQDHVHPTDTSRAPLASPALTGTPTAPTASTSTDTTQIATTAFVHDVIDGLDVGVSDVKVDDTSVVTNGVANINTFTGATSSAEGAKGLVPTPHSDGANALLFGNAQWGELRLYLSGNSAISLQKKKNNNGSWTSWSNLADAVTISDATTGTHGLMSTTDKTKLDGIASGAEVNQNAFGTVSVAGTSLVADSETDTLTITAGDNVTLTPTASSDSFVIAATDTTYSDATTSASGLMSSSDKAKLDDISGSTLDIVAGTNVTVTPDTSAGTLTISSANTTYPTGTASELTTGTSTSTRVWTPKVIADYVVGQIETAITGAAAFQGTAPTTFAPTDYKSGYYWVVGTAGTYVGETCEAGDMIFAVNDYSSAYSDDDFNVVQTNLDITAITNGEIDTIVAS